MNFQELLPWIITVFWLLTGASFYQQALIMYRNRSSLNVSRFEYLVIMIGNVLGFFYGIQINSLPLTITNIFSLGGSILVVLMHLRFRPHYGHRS